MGKQNSSITQKEFITTLSKESEEDSFWDNEGSTSKPTMG
jgi:hypothetical protein